MMFYQIWNIFKFRNPLQQANFCKHFTNVSNFPHLQKGNKVVFLLGIKTQSQTISIKTTTNLTMFPNINFLKYQLSKTEIFHNLVGVLLIYVRFRKDFSLRNFPNHRNPSISSIGFCRSKEPK